jgi:hypothetical protein
MDLPVLVVQRSKLWYLSIVELSAKKAHKYSHHLIKSYCRCYK